MSFIHESGIPGRKRWNTCISCDVNCSYILTCDFAVLFITHQSPLVSIISVLWPTLCYCILVNPSIHLHNALQHQVFWHLILESSLGSETSRAVRPVPRLPPSGHCQETESHDNREGLLASPDMIKSVSTRITPPVSPHHTRPVRDWGLEKKQDQILVISDPLVDRWPARSKKNTGI